MQTNPRSFYRYVWQKNRIKSRIGPFIKDGKVLTEPEAESLASEYAGAFTKRNMDKDLIDEGYLSSEDDHKPEVSILDDTWIQDCDVEKTL